MIGAGGRKIADDLVDGARFDRREEALHGAFFLGKDPFFFGGHHLSKKLCFNGLRGSIARSSIALDPSLETDATRAIQIEGQIEQPSECPGVKKPQSFEDHDWF